ncbi:DUF3322 and DUF2220 domain-containing protein [soil metagenome]
MTPAWTPVDDVVESLRARWERGGFLRAYAAGEPWTPVTVPITAPRADDFLHRLDGVRRWHDRFRRDSRSRGGRERFSVDFRTVRSPALGANEVPVRVHIDSFEQLSALLGTSDEVDALDEVLALTDASQPKLRPWVEGHPRVALAHRDVWADMLATLRWIVEHDVSEIDVRHLDLRGIDTKFVERHRKLLGGLLDEMRPPVRDHAAARPRGLAARFGFRPRPTYTRFRLLQPVPDFPAALTELELRTDELSRVDLPVRTVFVVENRATYLAFPAVTDAIVIFGEGFGATTLERLSWLAHKDIVYWGDIDTHGFAILSRLRERVPGVRSILMDRAALLAHRDQLVTEASPTAGALPHLTRDEQALYHDLVEDRYGPSVRLEQERIRFSLVLNALEPWTSSRSTVEQLP